MKFFLHYSIILIIFITCFGNFGLGTTTNKINYTEVLRLVNSWSKKIGDELFHLSNTLSRRKRVIDSYKETSVVVEDGAQILQDIAKDIASMMKEKEEAVKRIAKHTEVLVLNEKPPIWPNSSYDFYYANNLTTIELNETEAEQLYKDRMELENEWQCEEERRMAKHARKAGKPYAQASQSRECKFAEYIERPPNYYRKLPMKYNKHFETDVNLNYSSVRVTTNVYHREPEVLNGIRWSEPLDSTFIQNYKDDPTLTWQYFASPKGFMRHYPAVVWSNEPYDVTYEFRIHSWYTEAMSSSKDIIILLDRSGSMVGKKRNIANHIVNVILDTLNDNDFINIYTFANTTTPLVDCFNDTLVQANEENLRLLREMLVNTTIKFHADISIGMRKGFEILERFRKTSHSGAQCNQAIMLITEGIDYDYQPELIAKFNKEEGRPFYKPVRIFTYLIGTERTDAKHMTFIACSNMGYYVNISNIEEANEKVLLYLPVMSRPINIDQNQAPIWSSLYVDLADRRLSNWLWKKFEGNRQREVFLDHAKRETFRLKKLFGKKTDSHMLLQKTHKYERYKDPITFNYMTTVSLPVYDKRLNKTDLLGVAGIDVPITLIKSFIPHHRLGVNGYAFIITNNGYILTHPDLRSEFNNILKPTYNRVDMTEVEIMDDDNDPRLFNSDVVELRRNIIYQNTGHGTLKIKAHMDDMKRILKYYRNYTYTILGSFSLVIALPATYGFNNVKYPPSVSNRFSGLLKTKNWKVHPEWAYCKYQKQATPEENIKYSYIGLDNFNKCNQKLLTTLRQDAELTEWFEEDADIDWGLVSKYSVQTVFLAAYSGLTRWKHLIDDNYTKNRFEDVHNRAIDEVWYKRAVEENYNKANSFLYSVPFEIIGYENSTLVTSVHAIFSQTGNKKAPVAVTGLRFNQRALYNLFKEVTTTCSEKKCKITCESDELNCFILDNNGYVIVSDEIAYTGNFIGDIRPDIMYHLVKNHVYEATRMYDYQGICDKEPPAKSLASVLRSYIQNLLEMSKWALSTILLFVHAVIGGPQYQSIKPKTLAYERLEIPKTVPTPCDKEMWLFTLGSNTSSYTVYEKYHESRCSWPYVVQQIPRSNLLLLAINGLCVTDTKNTLNNGPRPKEILYNASLPCYIATKNNYTRRHYMKCYNNNEMEYSLNRNLSYCGSNGTIDI